MTKLLLEALHTQGRLGKSEKIAKAALFLANDDDSYINGATLLVDGDYTHNNMVLFLKRAELFINSSTLFLKFPFVLHRSNYL